MIDFQGNVYIIQEKDFESFIDRINAHQTPKEEKDEIWSVEKAAQNFEVSDKTIRRWIKYNDMPMRKSGNVLRGLKSEIILWFKQNWNSLNPE